MVGLRMPKTRTCGSVSRSHAVRNQARGSSSERVISLAESGSDGVESLDCLLRTVRQPLNHGY